MSNILKTENHSLIKRADVVLKLFTLNDLRR